MQFSETKIPGVIVIQPDVHRDSRGFFLETFQARRYSAGGIPGPFVQDNHSSSVYRTLRGLHMQITKPQGKLVRVIQGTIWDVAVDLRDDSLSFGTWVGETLSADDFRQLYVPPGCAHGFCVLSEVAQVEYKCTELYDPADELGIAYNDPDLAISWPVLDPILSERDKRHQTLARALQLGLLGQKVTPPK